MGDKYVTFSIRSSTLDRLKAVTPEGVTYSDFLEGLLDQAGDGNDGSIRRLALDFAAKVNKLASRK